MNIEKDYRMTSDDIYLVHDYLIQMGGAERVVAAMARYFPSAPIYTSATDYGRLIDDFKSSAIQNSWMQWLPGIRTHFKKFFPLYARAFASFHMPRRRAAWISASTFSKFIEPHPNTVTFCYCHRPTRFLWDYDSYVDHEVCDKILNRISRYFFPGLRSKDRVAAHKINYFIANSENVRKLILKHYQRQAIVIHPPVNVDSFTVQPANEGYDIVLSRLLSYKRIDLPVQAYTRAGRQLRVVGEGPDRKRLEGIAGSNVHFLGRLSEEDMHKQLGNARALVFPGMEDFGISPLEANACGKPVIAYAAGGALETVIEGRNGIFFREATPESLWEAVVASDRIAWDPIEIRGHAEQFSEKAFLERMVGFMEEALSPATNIKNRYTKSKIPHVIRPVAGAIQIPGASLSLAGAASGFFAALL